MQQSWAKKIKGRGKKKLSGFPSNLKSQMEDADEEDFEPSVEEDGNNVAGAEDLPTIDPGSNLVWFWWIFFVLVIFMILIVVALFLALRDPSWQQEQTWMLETGTVHSQVLAKIYENTMNVTQNNADQGAAITSMIDRKYPMHAKKQPTQRIYKMPPNSDRRSRNFAEDDLKPCLHFRQSRPILRSLALANNGTELRIDGVDLDRDLFIEFSASNSKSIKSPLKYQPECDYWTCNVPPIVLHTSSHPLYTPPPVTIASIISLETSEEKDLKWSIRLVNNDWQSLFIQDAIGHNCCPGRNSSGGSDREQKHAPPPLPPTPPYLTFGSTACEFTTLEKEPIPIEIQLKIHWEGHPVLSLHDLESFDFPKTLKASVETVEKVQVSQQTVDFANEPIQKIKLTLAPGTYRLRIEPLALNFSAEVVRAFSLESHIFKVAVAI